MNAVIEYDSIDIKEDTDHYRGFSGTAVMGLLAGILSVLAISHIAFLFIPIIAIVVNWRALRTIRDHSPWMLGRRAALAGIALALIFGLSGSVLPFGQELANRGQAIDVARYWFEALRDNRPEVAHQWTFARWLRVREGDSISNYYRTSKSAQKELQRFVQAPAVHALLNLGKSSHVRYCGNLSSKSTEELRTIVDVYSVTAKRSQETTSFFVQLTITARLDTMRKQWSWEVTKSQVLSQPPSLTGMLSEASP